MHSLNFELKSGSGQNVIRLCRGLALLLLCLSGDFGWAVGPSRLSDTYLRTRFSTEDGLYSYLVDDLVQSKDGFLWMRVNDTDLSRFDGRHFKVFSELGRVTSLAVAPDGDLWVGTTDALKRIPMDALNRSGAFPVLSYHPGPGPSSEISTLRFTREGVLWVGTAAGLYRFEHGAFSLAISGPYIERIEETANGHLWITIRMAPPLEWDGAKAVPHPELEGQLGVKGDDIFHIYEDSHGVTWFCTRYGVARRLAGNIEKLAPYGPQAHHEAFRVYEDPNGQIWFAKYDGLFRATSAGLELVVAGMHARQMYGDRDGNLWVSTNGDGLFRFKKSAVRTFTTADGLPNNIAMTVLAAHDGTVWAGFNCGGVTRFDGHSFRTYDEKDGLSNSCVWSLAEDANHDLWVGTYGGGIFRFHNGRFTQYSKANGLAGDVVLSVVAARDGSVWLAGTGVSRIREGRVRNYTTADGLSAAACQRVYQDRAGAIWVETSSGINRLEGDRFVTPSFLRNGQSRPIGEDLAGALYFVAYSPPGIFRVLNEQATRVVTEPTGIELRETQQGDLWLLSARGIFRVPPGSLDHEHHQDEPPSFEAFGLSDGMPASQSSHGDPVSALSTNGNLWIATTQGLAMVNVPHLPKTDREPAAYIEEVTIGRDPQAPGAELVLPAGTHHVELNFDPIDISSPEKIRLQYRMDGVDSEWLDAKSPGRAIYTNIPPGTHAFRIRACNRSGVWDQNGMVYYVTQRPYFHQTPWFVTAAIAFALLVAAGLYRLRMRQIATSLHARFDERLAERTRIARELHDTLLQSFHGLMFRFQAVRNMLPGRPQEASQALDGAILRAEEAISEGRSAIQDLRSAVGAQADLAESLTALGQELGTRDGDHDSPRFEVIVEGARRKLSPACREEIYQIGRELLQNAFQHAHAHDIEAEIRYDHRAFQFFIRDDGQGIDRKVLQQGGRPGHWGFTGVRERARKIGAQLDFWSEAGAGTEIQLTVPSNIAYENSQDRRRFRMFRKTTSS